MNVKLMKDSMKCNDYETQERQVQILKSNLNWLIKRDEMSHLVCGRACFVVHKVQCRFDESFSFTDELQVCFDQESSFLE